MLSSDNVDEILLFALKALEHIDEHAIEHVNDLRLQTQRQLKWLL